MSAQYTLKIGAEQAKEMPMVDLAFELLKAANTPFYYRDLMNEIAKIKGLSDEQVMNVIAQLYTEINIDGRFACVGTNLWGLKRWYPVEKSEDAMGTGKRPRIINDEDDDLDDEDLFAEEEDTFAEEEDYDSFDAPRDDFEAEEEAEEETEFFEDEEVEEEEIEDADLEEEEGDLEEEEADDDLAEDDDDDK
ncbi:DNA-directed RNA polymerase subunit delta [Paenibacillus mucilaginosus]|uniref:Probable DNA-directed RNA polymerase subunit delta n=3 Tax=Paenibacillus mucilaginosus TaxID=61624 RepID=H6NBJ1_9BACL|nr:DNA-directed RNA polymerase subunit delta [Paenibacillus mucilaginosus]AEI46136.1 DNA-directed RNA polymerase, delta subunit [Paenibacillus mucilaginosus KNP414]AFC33760.1 DNA-directed RNA polymerase subunit delta [Paenibacillus mucilaginosus 3016]AFH66092.1 DNA-directed RNA polymerase subunit delta [Paenibacillus mucilaginosus K02]MCG7213726.1 DNA-directed RNA polymerase subunit delta [Paenibacillus mucilaginosus]WDM27470.1 DNA-directed RNA polymerase subunit delta [Paenibacillus mucilagin